MKNLNIPFSRQQYNSLAYLKGERTWREAILEEFGVDSNTMSEYTHSTDREDWTYIAKCPNNGDCQPIIENPDAPDNPVDCEHLTLEASAKNSEYSPEELFPIEECPVCGSDLDFISKSEPSEVLE